MKQQLSAEAMESKRAYDYAYAKKYFRSKLITFNRKNDFEMAMLDWVNAQPEGGNKYIKNLIRQAMENATAEHVTANV